MWHRAWKFKITERWYCQFSPTLFCHPLSVLHPSIVKSSLPVWKLLPFSRQAGRILLNQFWFFKYTAPIVPDPSFLFLWKIPLTLQILRLAYDRVDPFHENVPSSRKAWSPRLNGMHKAIHNFFEQPVPVSHHCLVKNLFLMSHLNLSSFILKPFPHFLLLSVCVKSVSPFFMRPLKVRWGVPRVFSSPGWTTPGPPACPHRRGGPAFWVTSWPKYFDII